MIYDSSNFGNKLNNDSATICNSNLAGLRRKVTPKLSQLTKKRKEPKCHLAPLTKTDGSNQFFRVYEDQDIGLTFSQQIEDEDEIIIDSYQDDDV